MALRTFSIALPSGEATVQADDYFEGIQPPGNTTGVWFSNFNNTGEKKFVPGATAGMIRDIDGGDVAWGTNDSGEFIATVETNVQGFLAALQRAGSPDPVQPLDAADWLALRGWHVQRDLSFILPLFTVTHRDLPYKLANLPTQDVKGLARAMGWEG